MENETATANNPNDAGAPVEAPATPVVTATDETGGTQQTQTTQTPAAPAVETPANATETPAAAVASVVPEAYTFTAPEGRAYDPGILEAFTGAAKEAALTQDAAQKLIDKMAPALAARQADQITAIQEGWRTATTADKEIGGEKLQENLGVARKALDTFGTPELRTLLDETGLGNHPEVLRMFFRAGKAISEDKFVGGTASGAGKANAAAVLYDKTK